MSIKHIIRKIITTLLNAILSFVVFLIIVIFLYDRCRYYYELPDDMSFTIWKRFLKNECYIIPGEYKAFLPPKDSCIFSHKYENNSIFFLNDTLNTVVLEKEQRYIYCSDANCFNNHFITPDSGWNVVVLTDDIKSLIYENGFRHVKEDIGVCHIDYNNCILYKGKKIYRQIIFPWF